MWFEDKKLAGLVHKWSEKIVEESWVGFRLAIKL